MNRLVKRKELLGILFALPALILLTVFLFIPYINSVMYSFTNYNILKPDEKMFVGLNNYTRLLSDSVFQKSILNTLYFTVLVVPLQLFFALGLALLVNKKMKGMKFFRLAFFSPTILSLVVISMLWSYIYNPDNGLLNAMLQSFHLPPQPFLTSADQAMNCLIIMSAWQGAGYQMMIFLGGLQDIPEYLYDASSIDGATSVQKFKYITLPGLKNISLLIIITITISAFQLLIQPMLMTGGGPLDSTVSIVYEIYQYGYKYRDMGYGCAMTVVFTIMILAVALVQKKFLTEKDD